MVAGKIRPMGVLIVAASLVIACANFIALGQSGATESKEWPTYGHDPGGMRYSPLKQITPANVSTLKVAWTYHLKPADYVAPAGGRGGGGGRGAGGAEGAPPAGPQGAPLPGAAAGGPPAAGAEGAPSPGASAGGPPGGGRFGGRGNTGFRAAEVTPLVVNGTMYIGSPYGQVVALDPTSGKQVWVYSMPAGDSPATRGVEYFAGDDRLPPRSWSEPRAAGCSRWTPRPAL